MSGMTFTPAYYVYIRDSPSVLSTDTIPVLSAGLLLHTWAIGGLVYVLSCDIGWAKWALSIDLSFVVLQTTKHCGSFDLRLRITCNEARHQND